MPAPSPDLFQVDQYVLTLLDTIPEGGEIPEILEKALEGIGLERKDLITQLDHAIENHKALEEMFRSKSYELANRARYHAHRNECIREIIKRSLARLGETKFQTDEKTFSRYEGPESIKHVEVDLLPEEFIKKTAVNSAILKAYKETGKLPEGVEVGRSEVLAIRPR